MKRTIRCALLALAAWAPGVWALDLLQAYELAVESDPQLKAALASLEATRESRPQAKALLLPNVSVGGDVNRVYSNVRKSPTGSSGSEYYNDSALSISLVQPVYRRDRWVQLEQTDDLIASAEAEYAALEQDLMFRVADAYFGILDAEADLRAAEANKKATARQLEQAKQRFEVGLIAITDVHETQAAYDGANTTVISARNSIDTAWEALLEIIGPHAREDLAQLKDPIDLKRPEPADLDQWAQAALEQNLLIESAVRSAELARKNIELQRSGHYPTLDLVGSYATQDSADSRTGSRSDGGVIGLQLNVPLYQGGGVRSAVRQAHYDFEAAQDNLDAQRRSVNRTVKDAYRGVDTSISTVQSLAATVVSSKSALEATEAGYEVGTRTIIDVLNVQRNLFDAERNYARSRYQYVLSGLLLKLGASTLSPEDIAAVNGMLE